MISIVRSRTGEAGPNSNRLQFFRAADDAEIRRFYCDDELADGLMQMQEEARQRRVYGIRQPVPGEHEAQRQVPVARSLREANDRDLITCWEAGGIASYDAYQEIKRREKVALLGPEPTERDPMHRIADSLEKIATALPSLGQQAVKNWDLKGMTFKSHGNVHVDPKDPDLESRN